MFHIQGLSPGTVQDKYPLSTFEDSFALIYSSFIPGKIKEFFICLPVICIVSFEDCLFLSFTVS